jgi:hypothetical protein
MNFDKFIMVAKERITVEMKKYSSGEIKWNVSNQHAEAYLESAYANLVNDEAMRFKCYAAFNAELPEKIVDLGYFASTFDVEPLAAAWTQ